MEEEDMNLVMIVAEMGQSLVMNVREGANVFGLLYVLL